MTLKFPYWLASALLAIAFHLGLLLVALSQNSQGALAEGKQGIEIDLGMLGDFGEQLESQVSKPEVAIKQSKVIKEPPIEQTVEKTLKNVPEQTVDVVQETEVLVFDEPPDTSNDKPLIEDLAQDRREEVNIKDEMLLVDDLAFKEPEDAQSKEQSIVKSDKAQTQTKQTTGEANTLYNGGQSGVDQSYLAKLLAQLAQHKRYPLSSRRKAQEGIAVLDFEISRTGRVLVSHIQKSSGFHALDKAVLVMLKRAEPFPPVPPDIKGEPIRFTLPIAFRLNG